MFKQPKGLVVCEPQAASPSVMWYKKSRHFQLTEKEYNKERKEGVQKWRRDIEAVEVIGAPATYIRPTIAGPFVSVYHSIVDLV
mgnify:CR=1 FL=1